MPNVATQITYTASGTTLTKKTGSAVAYTILVRAIIHANPDEPVARRTTVSWAI